MVLRSISQNHLYTIYTFTIYTFITPDSLFLLFDTKIQQVQIIWWVIIKYMIYFEKQFSNIIYFWWGREGIWTYIFESDKSSFHLLTQPWSCCTKSVAPLGASSGCIRYNFFKQKWSSCVMVEKRSREK